MDAVTTLLFQAARDGTVDEAAEALAFGANMNARNSLGLTPLMYACWRGNVAVASLLLRMPGVDMTIASSEGLCAVHFAASSSPYKSDDATIDILRLLVAAGADVNARSSPTSDTAIMRAITSGCGEAVAFLAALDECDLSVRDPAGLDVRALCARYGSPAMTSAIVGAVVQRAAVASKRTADRRTSPAPDGSTP